jgi:small multidrug resistance family-3 protein
MAGQFSSHRVVIMSFFGWQGRERIVFSMDVLKSLLFFVIAGLLEISGGYLIWLWLREAKPLWLALLAVVILLLYVSVHTLQPAHFGRVYAAYGGVFIVLALIWGWRIDGVLPDRFDLIGAGLCFLGVLVIMYWPRG